MKKHTERLIKSSINEICEQAQCNREHRILHAWKWAKHRWHAHPSAEFTAWWSPCEFDETTGAHVGGHPDAYRKWAKKEPGHWIHKFYGVPLLDAWNSEIYRSEFQAWKSLGSPEKEPFVSVAATTERQQIFWARVKLNFKQVVRPMPRPTRKQLLQEALTG